MPSKYEPFREQIIEGKIPDVVLADMMGCTRSAIRTIRWKFLNPDKDKQYKKCWRKNNIKKEVRQAKKYQDTCKKNNWNSGTDWLPEEDEMILNRKKPDKKLSKILGRTLTSIWTRRYKLKKLNNGGGRGNGVFKN